MKATVKISGPSAKHPGNITFGTAFFLGIPSPEDPARGGGVLVTARHVLDEIAGEKATLLLRKTDAAGNYVSVPSNIQIRANGKNLYVTHLSADVAAMSMRTSELPQDSVVVLPSSYLVDDARLGIIQIHPGDELFCLGFPLNVELNTFPVLRKGTIASYPITPMESFPKLYYAFHVFPGNSGGPVYFSYTNKGLAGGAILMGTQVGIIGLVTESISSTDPAYRGQDFDLAGIVPSLYIKETIAQLPLLH